jgi:ubiquinone/menaquinone biosynthesis C-methylase UbiE
MQKNYFNLVIRYCYYRLSPELRLQVRRFVFLPYDLWMKVTGKREPLLPPRGMIFIGPGNFKRIGTLLKSRFIEYGGLKPEHRVLDIGCGIGRIAIPLTDYVNEKGSYEGFDIVKSGIDWCSRTITPRYPNFHFLHIDLKNSLYNSKTKREARDFTFPYPDRAFDFIICTSLFTHMMPDDTANYLKEIHRVLKQGGVCYASFFILNDTSKKLMEQNDEFNFRFDKGHYRLMSAHVQEANVAFEEDYLVNDMINPGGLKVKAMYYGYWSGREKTQALDFQDTIIFYTE